MPPTSSWWALETSSGNPDLARLMQEAKRGARRRRRRERLRDRVATAATCVFLHRPARGAPPDLRNVEGGRGRRFDCQEATRETASLTASRLLPCAFEMIAYGGRYGT